MRSRCRVIRRAFLILGLLWSSTVATHAAVNRLSWEKDAIDTDAGPDQADVQVDFLFRNPGDRPITITELKTSCGCTTTALEKKTYAPGETGRIGVTFTIGHRTGKQEKFIRVKTDAPGDDEPTELALRVNVRAYLAFAPNAVFWRTGEPPVEKTITCTALLPQDIALLEALTRDSSFHTRIEVVESGRKILLHVRPASTTAPANASIHLKFRVAGAKERRFDAYAYVIQPDSSGG